MWLELAVNIVKDHHTVVMGTWAVSRPVMCYVRSTVVTPSSSVSAFSAAFF